jgi:hypothetical protein
LLVLSIVDEHGELADEEGERYGGLGFTRKRRSIEDPRSGNLHVVPGSAIAPGAYFLKIALPLTTEPGGGPNAQVELEAPLEIVKARR